MKNKLVFIFAFTCSFAFSEQSIKGAPDYYFTDEFNSADGSEFWTSDAWATRSESCSGSSLHGKSLVFTYSPDKPEVGSGWSEQRFEIPIDAQQIEMRYDLYVPSNYVKAPGNHKNFVFWSGSYGMASGNIAITSESWPLSGGGTPSLSIGVDGDVYGHTMNKDDDLLYTDGLGDWIEVHVYIELAETEGDFGVFEISKNGSLINGTSYPNVEENWGAPLIEEQISYSSRGNFLKYGYLLGWANGGFEVDTEFCVDNFSFKANSSVKESEGSASISYRPVMNAVTFQ